MKHKEIPYHQPSIRLGKKLSEDHHPLSLPWLGELAKIIKGGG